MFLFPIRMLRPIPPGPTRLLPHTLAPHASRWTCLVLRTRPCLAPHVVRASQPRSCLALCTALPRAASTSLHWTAASRRAHVATVCFICFICMLHMFYLNVAKVDLVLHMLQWLYMYVASVCFRCFNYFKRMLQVFYLKVAYVALAIHACCNCMFQMS
jgi:hypothetical protein